MPEAYQRSGDDGRLGVAGHRQVEPAVGKGPGQQLGHGPVVQRPGEPVALALLAAEGDQVGRLLGLLDALGHGVELEGVAELHDGVGQGGVLPTPADPVDERLVDLEDVDREAAQVAERRVAGAEVVDGQQHPEPLELPQPHAHRLDVADQDALGDLDGELARRQPRGLERVDHLGDQALLLELAAGQVDVDRQRRRVRELALPAAGLEAGLEQHPVADRPDQPLLLGQGDERRRRQQPLDRVVPADQGLDPGDAARDQLEDRLVVQHQLVAVGHVAQLGLQLQALEHVLVHVGMEQLVAVLAPALAAYMATSALRSSSSASSTPGRPTAAPRLALIGMVRPLRPNGWWRVSRMRAATPPAASASVTRSSSTANSSPPRRAAVSLGRRQPWSRQAAATSSWSPAAWPRLSLTCLKSSRSMNSTARSVWSERARACSTRSVNRVRLARPVRPSWNAWWTSWASSSLRSETSRVFSTSPRTLASSSRLAATVSECSQVPSRWRTRQVSAAVTPGRRAASATNRATRSRSSGWTRVSGSTSTSSPGS